MAAELLDAAVEGRSGGRSSEPILSFMASAILNERLCSTATIEEFFRLVRSESVSSANPAAYMSIASSAVMPPSFGSTPS